jgi:hypothetical protein
MTTRICTCCGKAPADSSRRNYCRECNRTYQRDWARRHRGSKPRKTAPRPLEAHEKFCPRCELILSRDQFFKETRASDGLSSICKACEYWRQQAKRDKKPGTTRRKQRVRSAAFRAKNPGYNARVCRIYSLRRKAAALTAALERNGL